MKNNEEQTTKDEEPTIKDGKHETKREMNRCEGLPKSRKRKGRTKCGARVQVQPPFRPFHRHHSNPTLTITVGVQCLQQRQHVFLARPSSFVPSHVAGGNQTLKFINVYVGVAWKE
jgi:hypothetical protein